MVNEGLVDESVGAPEVLEAWDETNLMLCNTERDSQMEKSQKECDEMLSMIDSD